MFDILLDIDVDFFYGPPAYNPEELNPDRFKAWLSAQDFLAAISRVGLRLPSRSARGMADHKEAYFHWKRAGFRDALVVHFDAHSDCYQSLPEVVHCGNFLRKAILEGIVGKVIWVIPTWYYANPCHPMAQDALESVQRRVYRDLPIEVVRYESLARVRGRPAMVTLAGSPSFVPPCAQSDHFMPLAHAFGIGSSPISSPQAA